MCAAGMFRGHRDVSGLRRSGDHRGVSREFFGRKRERLRPVEELEAENAALRQRVRALEDVLEFYANPDNYFAIGFLPDHPCGDFITDWSWADDWATEPFNRKMPGKRARDLLAAIDDADGPLGILGDDAP